MDPAFHAKSLRWWLTALLAAGIFFVGARFFLDPVGQMREFGLTLDSAKDLAWIWTIGIRDIALGLILAAILVMKQRRIAGVLALVSLVIPIGDGLVVLHTVGWSLHLAIHAVTAIYMAVLGGILLSEKLAEKMP